MGCNTCGKKSNHQVEQAAQTQVRPSSHDFVRARAAICSVCDQNNSGVCGEQKKLTPDKECLIQIGIVDKETKCPKNLWGKHDENKFDETSECSRCRRIHKNRTEICKVCINEIERRRRNADKGIGSIGRNFATGDRFRGSQHLDNRMWSAVKENPGRGRSHSAFTAMSSSTKFLTVSELANDSVKLASLVPHDVQGIIGVARSGMTPANIVSTMLHLPIMALRQTKNDIVPVGNGWRMGGNDHVGLSPDAKVCVIDDTCMTGNSFKAITPLLNNTYKNFVTAALYVNPLAKKKPDLWVHDLQWPHLLEWNLWNSVLSPNCATDFDGVLCHDYLPHQDDDGKAYLNFIENAIPRYLTRKVEIPLIVTARIEKYRKPTEEWLNKHGVRFRQLIMHPAKTLAERNRDDIAAYKARHFEKWAANHTPIPKPSMFIESDDNQSKRIHDLTDRLVVCPSSAKVYGDPRRSSVKSNKT
jgi:adenine/guanine phosphoribosyltransferase-like PRPP-binding protein